MSTGLFERTGYKDEEGHLVSGPDEVCGDGLKERELDFTFHE